MIILLHIGMFWSDRLGNPFRICRHDPVIGNQYIFRKTNTLGPFSSKRYLILSTNLAFHLKLDLFPL